MDFIKKLLFSSSFDTILVIVNQLSKQVIFILISDTITFTELARLFAIYIFSKHRVLSHITCIWGSKFVFSFFYFLGTILNMCFHFTMSYHQEEDEQIERTNQTLKQYLWVYCNYQQDN